jgi:hypothetical protein
MADKKIKSRVIVPTEGPLIIDAPRVGFAITIMLLVGLALVCFYVVKQGLVLYNITHILLPVILSMAMFIVWVFVFIQVISHRIKLEAGEIIESSLCHSKLPIIIADINNCTANKHYSRGGDNGRNWRGEFIFHMKNGSERKIMVSPNVFYVLEDEIKKRYRFLQ